jgi:ABC-type proline/glycine betaine transport system permease subunit
MGSTKIVVDNMRSDQKTNLIILHIKLVFITCEVSVLIGVPSAVGGTVRVCIVQPNA